MIPPATIDEIIEKAGIVEIIGRDVKLKRAGREWRGLSPFKTERTPSFFVSDIKRRFFDFASGMNGTVIKFLMELRRWSFPETMEFLAAEVGVQLTGTQASRQDYATKGLKAETQAALDLAHAWFQEQMRRRPEGRAYAASRGLTEATIRELGIGYAPPQPYALREALSGFSRAALKASALFLDEADRRDVAFLRNRLVFPIRDRRGMVVSFGGRAIDAAEPKYLNGRESLLFHKGRTLYNLSAAETAIRSTGSATVMEGYIDVAIARQSGISNVVAPLGSALTLEQAWLLWRQAPEIAVCLDGDAAGDKASARLLEAALPALAGDRRLGFIRLPSGLDPDDYLRAHGRASFDALARGAESAVDRLWRWIASQLSGSATDRAAHAAALTKTLTEEIADEALRDAYRRELRMRAWSLSRSRTSDAISANGNFHSVGIAGREAAIACAVAMEPRYVDLAADRLGSLAWSAPIVGSIVTLALNAAGAGAPLDQMMISRDLAVLRSCIAAPTPSYLASFNPTSFAEALEVQAEGERRRRLRSLS